jgi:hypothetical protein
LSADLISFEAGRDKVILKRIKRIRQGKAAPQHECTCAVAPAPPEKPRAVYTVYGWMCSACGAMLRGHHA